MLGLTISKPDRATNCTPTVCQELPSEVLDWDVVGLVAVNPLTCAVNHLLELRSSISYWLQS